MEVFKILIEEYLIYREGVSEEMNVGYNVLQSSIKVRFYI